MNKKVDSINEINKIKWIYIHQIFRVFALSLITIFVPIYLLTLNYTLNQVIIFFLIYNTAIIVFAPLAVMLSKKIGYKSVIITSMPILIVYFFLLLNIKDIGIPLYFVSFLGGFECAFYWMPFHSFFVKHSSKTKRGFQFSKYLTLGGLAGFIGPILGGLIFTFLGSVSLFYFSIFFVIISLIPLFKLDNLKPSYKFSLSKMISLSKSHKKLFIGTVAENSLSIIESIFWPIFIFYALNDNILSVGFVGALITFGSMLFTLVIGKVFDKQRKLNMLRLGGLFYAVIWILRIYLQTSFSVYILSVMAGFFALMISLSIQVFSYEKIDYSENKDEFIVFIELPCFIGRVIPLLLLLFLPNKIISSFIIATFASLFLVVLVLERKILIDEKQFNLK
jgi:MFS family permease